MVHTVEILLSPPNYSKQPPSFLPTIVTAMHDSDRPSDDN